MSKTKPAGPGHYEVLFIAPNKYTEEEAAKVSEEVKTLIVEKGGIVTHHEYWGKKKLAYQIDHNHFGYYNLYEFDLEKPQLQALNNLLRLFEKILRHQIITIKKRSEKEIVADKAKATKLAQDEKDEKDEEIKEKEQKVEKDEKEIEAEKKKKKKDEGKANLEDLDKKLEGILEAKDLIK